MSQSNVQYASLCRQRSRISTVTKVRNMEVRFFLFIYVGLVLIFCLFSGSNQVCELCGHLCKSNYAKHMYEKHGVGDGGGKKVMDKESRRFICEQCPREYMTKKLSLIHI